MSCNSAIYIVNASNYQVNTTAGQFVQVPLGSIVRRFGKLLNLDGGSIIACGSGYFDCSVSLTASPTATGPISMQLYKDNQPILGAIATETAAAAGNAVNLAIMPLIRNCGCNCNSTLSLWVNAPCIITNLSTKVLKA